MKVSDNQKVFIGFVAVILLFVGFFALCMHVGDSFSPTNPGPSFPEASTPVVAPPTPEMELAAAQEGHSVDASDPLVAQFAAQLDQMEGHCDAIAGANISRREGLARVTISSHQQMAQRGVDEDYLSIITHVNASISPGQQMGQHIADVFSAYVVLRTPH